jgi:hypothetical protein
VRPLPLIAIAVFIAGAARPQARQPAAACNRDCLEGFVNQYLGAMVARNPHGLPLASNIRFSENDQLIPFGDGLWNTATGIGTYKLYVSDPQAGQIGFLGMLRENGRPVALALRLKITNRAITETETVVLRDGTAAVLEEIGKPDPLYLEALPVSERVPRSQMTDTVDGYFRSVREGAPGDTIYDPDCSRVQNGFRTTSNPQLPAPAGLSWNPFELGCRDQVNSGFFSFIQDFYPRRHAVIDEERGIVFGFYMAHINGTVTSINTPRGKITADPDNTSPAFIHAAEGFKFRQGKVRCVQTLQIRLPYGTVPILFGRLAKGEKIA